MEHNLVGALLASNNLSDLSSASTARTNLGLTALATVAPGTGVATALAVNVGTAGAFVVNGGALGTPSSGALTNCTFPTLNQNTSGSAASLSVSGQTGLITFAGTASTSRIKTVRDAADTILELGGSYTPTGSWTSMTLVTPALGTPASGTLTNCTGLPVASGISGLGTGVATFLATPSSANLAAALTDEDGTGLVPFELTGSWTPVLTFATPGNLSVSYSSQVGAYTKVGRTYYLYFNIATSAYTQTTASGALTITGLPATSSAGFPQSPGSLIWGGITKASFTQVSPSINFSSNTMTFLASGSGQAASNVNAADMPTGGTIILRGQITYFV
jgi:hypothetical protein